MKERPNHIAGNLLLAEVLMKVGEPDVAVKRLEAIAPAEPEMIEPQYLLVILHTAARDGESALALLRRIAGDHPKEALCALRVCAPCTSTRGRWDEAMEVHKRLTTRFLSELNQAERAQGVALIFRRA